MRLHIRQRSDNDIPTNYKIFVHVFDEFSNHIGMLTCYIDSDTHKVIHINTKAILLGTYTKMISDVCMGKTISEIQEVIVTLNLILKGI